jgi:hypothetical protein
MMSRVVLAGTIASLLAACGSPERSGNDQTARPPAVEQANVADEPPVNQAVNEVNTAEPAPAAEPPKSCEAEIGKEAATELAKRCRFVSPATRPPCHPANPCEMIQGEIDRSCDMFGDDKPAECDGQAKG